MEIGILGGIFLIIIMSSMVFVGLHINKPFPWENKSFDKSNIKNTNGDNT